MKDKAANCNCDTLERIVALLFALANLAELAVGAPFLRRRQVLGILSRGEAEARAFLTGIPTGETTPADASSETGRALRLAAGFRMLALLLSALLSRGKHSACPGAADCGAGHPQRTISGRPVRRLRAPASPAPDTS